MHAYYFIHVSTYTCTTLENRILKAQIETRMESELLLKPYDAHTVTLNIKVCMHLDLCIHAYTYLL